MNMKLQLITKVGVHPLEVRSISVQEIPKLLEKLLQLEDAEGEILCAVREHGGPEPRFATVDMVLKEHCRTILILGSTVDGRCKASLKTHKCLERRGEALNMEI